MSYLVSIYTSNKIASDEDKDMWETQKNKKTQATIVAGFKGGGEREEMKTQDGLPV